LFGKGRIGDVSVVKVEIYLLRFLQNQQINIFLIIFVRFCRIVEMFPEVKIFLVLILSRTYNQAPVSWQEGRIHPRFTAAQRSQRLWGPGKSKA
jgi:hypothetical protein